MPWCSPLTRREISLVLFSIATFVLFYNLETSFWSDTVNLPSGASGKTDWDDVIYGNWSWEEDLVAENARKQAIKEKNRNSTVSFHPHTFGLVGVNDGILEWDDEIPMTTVLKHAPGYTVMDNVFMLNGTLFLVTNDPAFPPLDSIASSYGDPHMAPRPSDWQVLSITQARETLGSFGGLIHGAITPSSLSGAPTLHSIRPLSPDALTLPPPRRDLLSQRAHLYGRTPRSKRTRHPSPTVSERFPPLPRQGSFPDARPLVVADQGAARRADKDVPPFAVPLFELKASKDWWEPVRREVARFLGVPEDAPKAGWLAKDQTMVTYISRQDAVDGPRLRAEDHAALVEALGGLGKGYEVYVVSSETDWMARMSAIAQSTIVLGVYGVHMADSLFMPPSSRATMGYVAWVEERQYPIDALPPIAPPHEGNKDEVPIDVSAMIQAIKRLV
ncbi:hypothetical protein JVU11DRAFT_5880 [Chiua virens]|nr:hypothetical protein JVU11DRAFT_5880 [Chiua virens]